mgnify:CR=1 FL=1
MSQEIAEDAARLVELTTQAKPVAATHWSTRKMAAELGVSASTVMCRRTSIPGSKGAGMKLNRLWQALRVSRSRNWRSLKSKQS